MEDLVDVRMNIDKEKFPDRYEMVQREIERRRNEPTQEVLHVIERKPNIYPGIGRRFLATIIEGIVWLPFLPFNIWIASLSPVMYLTAIAFEHLFFLWYLIYFHTRWGQSVGKMVMRIQVVRKTGSKIGWREAIWRYIPNIGMSIMMLIERTFSLIVYPDSYFGRGSNDVEIEKILSDPCFVIFVCSFVINFVWLSLDILTLLVNRKRRALHDYIAGTVVIRKGANILEKEQA